MTPQGGYREGAGRKPSPWPTQLIKIKCTDAELRAILQKLSTRERAEVMLSYPATPQPRGQGERGEENSNGIL